jgi:hypothetical protein
MLIVSGGAPAFALSDEKAAGDFDSAAVQLWELFGVQKKDTGRSGDDAAGKRAGRVLSERCTGLPVSGVRKALTEYYAADALCGGGMRPRCA